ncbi:phosphate transporter family protein [Burkholderia cepacia]|nr:phosphate transporter family protein [Burkholderia cepacia]
MPNLAATETSGAVSNRTRAVSLALFFLIIACGIVYVGVHLGADLSPVKESSVLPFLLLIVALLIALGFEFVNGFHDTANAVATVIYTHSLDPHLAVMRLSLRNLFGVRVSSGAGLRRDAVHSLLLAWVLTLPASIALSAALYWALHRLF